MKNAQLNWLHKAITSKGYNKIKTTITHRDNKANKKSHKKDLTSIHVNAKSKHKINIFVIFLPSTIPPNKVNSQPRKYTSIFNQ